MSHRFILTYSNQNCMWISCNVRQIFYLMQDKGVNLLTLRAPDLEKYVLVLMDALFSDSEMATSWYVVTVAT